MALLAIVALLGWTMFFVWLRQRREGELRPSAGRAAAGPGNAPGDSGVPAEQAFPVAVVTAHGVLAVTTVLLVLLAALGVGD